MTTEEKFHAAVNVIRNLPKNGSYQPSHELMLRFYAFFKQATLGPCNTGRPGFWDPVGRYKYDAHKALGNMPKEQAMRRYVEELHTIVETLSYSDGVKTFLEAGDNEIDSVDFSDLEKIAPDVMKRVRSQSNSPLLSREPSPERSSRDPSNQDTDVSDEEYSDTVEVIIKEDVEESKRPLLAVNGINHNSNSSFNHITNGPVFHKSRVKSDGLDISVHVLETVDKMKREFERIENRMYLLENETRTHNGAMKQKLKMNESFSLYMVLFMVGWPFLASLIMHKFFLNKRA